VRLDHLLSKEHLALGSAGHLVGSGVQSQLRAFAPRWFAQADIRVRRKHFLW
jgi:hypothetical protein